RCAFTEASLFFSSRRRHTRSKRDWSSDVCSSDLVDQGGVGHGVGTDRAHHVDLRAELGGGHGLVSALAAGADLTTATQQGFAGVGVAVDRGGQIRVDGSDNNNGSRSVSHGWEPFMRESPWMRMVGVTRSVRVGWMGSVPASSPCRTVKAWRAMESTCWSMTVRGRGCR